ncbi:efflux RND transporter periplasmic adaptor subunit [Lysobacter sp. A421]
MRSRFAIQGIGARSLVAGALLAGLLAGCGPSETADVSARPVLVTQPVAADAVHDSLAGAIRAREESQLSFRVGGQMIERKADVGDHVSRGDVLATLDPDDLKARANAAQAQLAAAQAELGRARADQARYAALANDQLVSRSSMDAQNAAATAAQGQVDAARAELEVASNQAQYSQLRAPADGVIAERQAETGQVVAAGQAVFTMAADGGREVAFAVSEGQVAAIKPGQAVQVEVWSRPGERWPGVVREIAPVADPASRTFAVRATVDAPTGVLALGQSARVFLPGQETDALSIPLTALQPGGDGEVAVFVVDPQTSTLKLLPVSVGAYGSQTVPVLDGLAPDAWVVAAGGHLLREGQTVRPVDRDNRDVATADARH